MQCAQTLQHMRMQSSRQPSKNIKFEFKDYVGDESTKKRPDMQGLRLKITTNPISSIILKRVQQNVFLALYTLMRGQYGTYMG